MNLLRHLRAHMATAHATGQMPEAFTLTPAQVDDLRRARGVCAANAAGNTPTFLGVPLHISDTGAAVGIDLRRAS